MDVDEGWQAVLDLCRSLGPVIVTRSERTGKPAIFLSGREFVQWVGPGSVRLHIAEVTWLSVADRFADDPCVARETGRPDSVELHMAASDAERLRPLFVAALG